MPDIIGSTHLVISLLGFSGLVYWIIRQNRILQGVIEAQKEALNVQEGIRKSYESLAQTMQKVLESTDETKMLKRLEDYKKFADHENEMVHKQVVERSVQFFEKIIQRIQERPQEETIVEPLSQMTRILANLIVNFSPFAQSLTVRPNLEVNRRLR